MKKRTYTVSMIQWREADHLQIEDEEGNTNSLWPVKVHETVFGENYEISSEFFQRLGMIQSCGHKIKFDF